MMRRRRPLARAAMVGGAAFYAGKKGQQASQREQEQQYRLDELEAQQQQRYQTPPPTRPRSADGAHQRGDGTAAAARPAQGERRADRGRVRGQEARLLGDGMSTPGRSPRIGPLRAGADARRRLRQAGVHRQGRASSSACASSTSCACSTCWSCETTRVRSRCTSRAISTRTRRWSSARLHRRADRPRHGRPRDGRGDSDRWRGRARGRSRDRRGHRLVRGRHDPERECSGDRADRAPLGDPAPRQDRRGRWLRARRRGDYIRGSDRARAGGDAGRVDLTPTDDRTGDGIEGGAGALAHREASGLALVAEVAAGVGVVERVELAAGVELLELVDRGGRLAGPSS